MYDDVQLYPTCKNTGASKTIIEWCVVEIRAWMASNRLMLNDAKTKVLHFHSKFRSCDLLYTSRIGMSLAPRLIELRCKQECYRSSALPAPRMWNSLPLQIRQSRSLSAFPSRLKTVFPVSELSFHLINVAC